MNKQEFEKLAGQEVTPKQFEAINTVYTFHPSISETTGKQQIAALFITHGYRIIVDMLTTAEKAETLEAAINEALQLYNSLCKELKALKDGN